MNEPEFWSDGVRCPDPADSPRGENRGGATPVRRARCGRRAPLRSRHVGMDGRDLRAPRGNARGTRAGAPPRRRGAPRIRAPVACAARAAPHPAGGAGARVPSAGDDLRHAVRARLSRASRAASAPSSLRRRRRRSGAASDRRQSLERVRQRAHRAGTLARRVDSHARRQRSARAGRRIPAGGIRRSWRRSTRRSSCSTGSCCA